MNQVMHWIKSNCAAVIAVACLIAYAQTRAAAIDPSQVVDHFQAFGPWEVMCDVNPQGGQRRCYIRVVEVYSPRPDFKAAFAFVMVEPRKDGKVASVFEFSIEPGFNWSTTPLSIAHAGGRAESINIARCTGAKCVIRDNAGTALAQSLVDNSKPGSQLILSFTEKDGKPRTLAWRLEEFGAAMRNFADARRARGLL